MQVQYRSFGITFHSLLLWEELAELQLHSRLIWQGTHQMLEECFPCGVGIVTVPYIFHRFCTKDSKVNIQRLRCVRWEETLLVVSIVAGVTEVPGLPEKLCTTCNCTSGMMFQLWFVEQMQTVVSAQFLGVHPQLYIYNVKLQITTMFVVIFFYLATVLNRKAAFIKQRSET